MQPMQPGYDQSMILQISRFGMILLLRNKGLYQPGHVISLPDQVSQDNLMRVLQLAGFGLGHAHFHTLAPVLAAT